MGDSHFDQALESLAEAVVMLPPDERMPLEDVRSKFQRLVTLLPDDEEILTAVVAEAITHIDRVLGGYPDPQLTIRLGETVERIQRMVQSTQSADQSMAIDQARQQFIDEHRHTGQMLVEQLRRAIRQRHDDAFVEFRRVVHSLKGEAGVLGLDELNRLCHRIETALLVKPLPLAWLGDACSWIDRYINFLAGGDPPGAVADADSGITRSSVHQRTIS